jgi:hypothetical protein
VGETGMLKVLFAVIVLIAAAMIAGVYFSFNPVILIFGILGVGLFMVCRIGGPTLPEGSFIPWGSGLGIYMRGRDHLHDDTSPSGEDPREGDGFR